MELLNKKINEYTINGLTGIETNKYKTLDKSCEFVTLNAVKNGKKEYIQLICDADGSWKEGAPEPLPIFNQLSIKEAKRVLFVTSEAEVKRIFELGINDLAAVTTPKMQTQSVDFALLEGKEVFIWRSCSDAGQKYENDLLAAVKRFAASVAAVKVDALELQKDQNVIDYLKKSKGNREAETASVELNLSEAEILHGVKAVTARIEDTISGKFKNINFPRMSKLSNLSKALLPGTITTICGEAGSGKSFFNIENAWRWVCEEGLKVKILMLEDDQATHQARALAQMAESSGLTFDDFIAKYPDYARKKLNENKDKLAQFAQALECTRTGQMTLLEIGDWIIRQVKEGAEIVCVDPITAAKQSGQPWIDDMIFLFRIKQIVERFGARLILYSHPRTGKAGEMSLAGIAGGAAYPRFSQAVIWIKNSEKPVESPIMDGGFTKLKTHRQTFRILKCRHGKGFGMSIAADLCRDTSCVVELGMISRRKELVETTEKESDFDTPTVKDGKQLRSPKDDFDNKVSDFDDFDADFLKRQHIKDIDSPFA